MSLEIGFLFAVLAVMVYLFLTERLPIDLTAFLGLVIILFAGFIEHRRILEKLGATEVFFPDKDMAFALAERLPNPNMLEYLPFIEGYSIIETAVPDKFVGKTLRDLDLINSYGIQVLAVKELIPERVNLVPTAKYVLKGSDILILLGPDSSLVKLKAE